MNKALQGFIKRLHHMAVSGEDAVDQLRTRVSRNLGTSRPQQIVAYHGYADLELVHICGRVLSNRPLGGALDEDAWWDNLANTLLRWESDEVPGEPVTVRYQEHEQTVVTDEEGYYQIEFPTGRHCHEGILWLTANARAGRTGREVSAVHDIMLPPATANFGIISDLDDTVIHTGVTSLMLAAKLTFLENARTRKPLEGVAALYQELQHGLSGIALNPIFYISSSPWNLHDLLIDFLRLNGIPPGPLLLRDFGLDRAKVIKEKGHGHKKTKAMTLLDSYPDLPFILFGDASQEDPAIYAELTALRPGRIKSIYIRDANPDAHTSNNHVIHQCIDSAAANGVPMILARDSQKISEHARSIGLLEDLAIDKIVAEVRADRARLDVGEQALRTHSDPARK